MPFEIQKTLPETEADFKQAVYNGTVFILPATPESLALIDFAQKALAECFSGIATLPQIHAVFPGPIIYQRAANVRQHLAAPEISRAFIRKIIQPTQLLTEDTVFEVLRLRCNPHHDGEITEAVYNAVHRDTWYANPQCQINWWIPLFDTCEEQTFHFFPRYFEAPIENTSEGFDYDNWSQNVGFQSSNATDAQAYPTAKNVPDANDAVGFHCKAGEIVIFSGAHLHKTAPNRSGLSRFSLDFRTVSLTDRNSKSGAPNVDNHARGDASNDYFPLWGTP